MLEIYDYEERIQRFRRRIKDLRNGELALHFLDHLEALELAPATVSKYAGHLPALLRAVDFDLQEATRRDVERVVAWISRQPYKERTKEGKKMALRKLVQYAKFGSCSRETPIPPEVGWYSLTVKEKDSRVTPESLITPLEFGKIVKAAENSRDRALVYVPFEAALRPGEILTMSVGSVEFKDRYCLISVNGKTGIKRIPLVVSYKPLLEWMREHPDKENPEAPLWCSLAHNYKGQRLSYRHFRMILKRLGKKAGIRKDVWPYLFRHSTLTAMAKVFTEAMLEQFAGWVHGSRMTRRYVHFSARDLEDAVLELHGLKEPSETEGIPRIAACPRCRTENPFGAVRCSFCGYIVDKETALKMEEEERVKDREIMERLERLEGVVSSLLESWKGNGAPQPNVSTQKSPEGSPPKPSSQQEHTSPNRPP